MPEVSHSNRIWYVAIALFLIVGVLAGLLLPIRSGSFPPVAPGMYTGTITGLDGDTGVSHAFYLERLPSSNVFILVAFLEGARPQAVAGEPLRSESGKEASFSPLPFIRDQRSFLLQGEIREDVVQGDVFENSQKVGHWEIRPRSESDIVFGSPGGEDIRPLQEWLSGKAEQRRLRREVRALESELRLEQDKRVKLEGFVRDEKLLQRRASERRDELANELRVAVEERKSVAATLGRLTRDLETLGNVTKTGQAVTLARRVAHRENQWYLANWDEAGAVLGSDDGGSAVDVQKLEQQVRKANEVQSLLHELATEREKLQQLKRRLAGEPPEVSPDPMGAEAPPVETRPEVVAPTQRPTPEQKQSLWDQLF